MVLVFYFHPFRDERTFGYLRSTPELSPTNWGNDEMTMEASLNYARWNPIRPDEPFGGDPTIHPTHPLHIIVH